MQDACGIANATRVHRHINDLLLDLGRLPGVAILEEKRTATIQARPAPITLLALPCRAMAHNIHSLTMRAVEHLDHHKATRSCWSFSVSCLLNKKTRSTPVKHLRHAYTRIPRQASVAEKGRLTPRFRENVSRVSTTLISYKPRYVERYVFIVIVSKNIRTTSSSRLENLQWP